MAALLLGAKSAVGVDIDPLAVKTAVENAETNGVAERFTGICGNLAEKVTGKFQVVAANIVVIRHPLQRRPPLPHPGQHLHRQRYHRHPGAGRSAAIQDTFQVLERREEKGWVAMALKLK
ncbi:MAG: 50S ribosomal protein L11 methyltransferase [Acutalibacter sp.]